MKREIKFRAWDKEHKKMFWVRELGWDISGQWNVHRSDIDWKYKNGDLSHTEYELLQYTGLKDKNGKEIYEGDILESPNRGRRIIVWEDSEAAFIIEGTYPNRMAREGIIIGNIYENSELLVGEEKR